MDEKPPIPPPTRPKAEPQVEPMEYADDTMQVRAAWMALGEPPEGEGFQVCLPHPVGMICHSRDDCIVQERLDRQALLWARLRGR